MAKCQFATQYWNLESGYLVDYKCPDDEETLGSGRCIFHDENYLQDKTSRKVPTKLMAKVHNSIDQKEALLCIGYHLPDNITIEGDFTKPVYFCQAKLQRIDFSSAKFSGGANFSAAEFSGGANFRSAEFSEVSFRGAKFSGGADFDGAKFSGGANFRSAGFSGGANFGLAKFSKEAYFGSAKFSGEADFRSAKFSEKANFDSAKFSGEADFRSAEFSEVNFDSAEFSGGADFVGAKFSGGADFVGAKFKEVGEAAFVGANFERADFSRANFEGPSNFAAANFGDINFTGANFKEGGIAYFRLVNIKKEATFSRAAFFDRTYFSGNFNDTTRFNRVLFEGKEKIEFDVDNLSNVSFMNTDITRVRFSEKARWGQREKDEDRFKVIEERWLEESVKKSPLSKILEGEEINDLGSIMAVYRNLRENYEFRLRYDEAGKFFIREMELKRKYDEVISSGGKGIIIKKKRWPRRNLSLTGLYYHFSTYGESIIKPTIIGVIIVGLSTLFWLMQSNPTLQPTFSTNVHTPYSNFTGLANATNHTQLLKAFERSLADFLPIISLGSDIKVGIVDFIVKIVGGALTFVLLGVALRRKFERKYTR